MDKAFAELIRSLEIANDNIPFGILDDKPWVFLPRELLYLVVRGNAEEASPRQVLLTLLDAICVPKMLAIIIADKWEERMVVPYRFGQFVRDCVYIFDEIGIPDHVPSTGV